MRPSRALLSTALASGVLGAASCGHDWDFYDPGPSGATSGAAPGGAGGAASSGSGSGASVTAGGSGGGGGSGPSSGPTSASTGGSAPWYDDALSRRRPITISAVDAALTEFPVLVPLDPATIDYAATADGGSDLRFVADDQSTLLAHDIDTWSGGGDSAVWVRVPALAVDGTTTIWLYHAGNPASPALAPSDTWSSGFEAVWHLSPGAKDASGHAHDGAVSGGVASGAAGIIGSAHAFDGSNDALQIPASPAIDALFVGGATISGWIRPTSSGGGQRGRVFDRTLDATFGGGWALLMSDYNVEDSIGFAHGFTTKFDWWTTPASSIALMTWQHVAVTFTSGDLAPELYVDGVAQQVALTDGGGMGAPATPTPIASTIGNRTAGTDRAFAGTIDELRLSATVRSPAWIAAEVRSGQGTLLTVGAEEQQ